MTASLDEPSGGVAQLVERLTGSQEVRGFESLRLHSEIPDDARDSRQRLPLSVGRTRARASSLIAVPTRSPYTFSLHVLPLPPAFALVRTTSMDTPLAAASASAPGGADNAHISGDLEQRRFRGFAVP
jgi:hypothetical protein